MIVFDLECRLGGHRFEGWFGSSDDFAAQQERGLVECPICGAGEVIKAPMAPNVARKGNQGGLVAPKSEVTLPMPAASVPVPMPVSMAGGNLPPEARKLLQALAKVQAEALKTSRWVGSDFAEDARAMHYGEQDAAPIHGQATPEEAQELLEEGIAVAPLLFPIGAPDETH